MDNRFNPRELVPKSRAYIVREDSRGRGVDVMAWDVLGGGAAYPMTNVRDLALPQWRKLAASPDRRCLVPVTEFAEWTPDKHDVGGGKPIKGEMWFAVPSQPMFAIAGFWQPIRDAGHFAMVTCSPNALVKPIHPKAMVTILAEANWDRWLTGSYDDVLDLQRPYPPEDMTVRGPVFPTRAREKSADPASPSLV